MSQDWTRFFEKDKFAFGNGMKVIEARPGYAVTRMEITEDHMNAGGFVQGGAIFTLADLAFAAASNSKGSMTVGVNVNISYFKSPQGRFMTARATEISSGRRLCCYNVDVFDENEDLVARFTGTGYMKKEKIDGQ